MNPRRCTAGAGLPAALRNAPHGECMLERFPLSGDCLTERGWGFIVFAPVVSWAGFVRGRRRIAADVREIAG